MTKRTLLNWLRWLDWVSEPTKLFFICGAAAYVGFVFLVIILVMLPQSLFESWGGLPRGTAFGENVIAFGTPLAVGFVAPFYCARACADALPERLGWGLLRTAICILGCAPASLFYNLVITRITLLDKVWAAPAGTWPAVYWVVFGGALLLGANWDRLLAKD